MEVKQISAVRSKPVKHPDRYRNMFSISCQLHVNNFSCCHPPPAVSVMFLVFMEQNIGPVCSSEPDETWSNLWECGSTGLAVELCFSWCCRQQLVVTERPDVFWCELSDSGDAGRTRWCYRCCYGSCRPQWLTGDHLWAPVSVLLQRHSPPDTWG